MGDRAAPRRGELFWVDWSPSRGSESAGRRPALILQRDAGNLSPTYPNTVVLVVSSQGRDIPFHVKLKPSRENGLRNVSFVKCEQIFTLSKDRLGGRIGRVRPDDLLQIEEAVRLNLALEAGAGSRLH